MGSFFEEKVPFDIISIKKITLSVLMQYGIRGTDNAQSTVGLVKNCTPKIIKLILFWEERDHNNNFNIYQLTIQKLNSK